MVAVDGDAVCAKRAGDGGLLAPTGEGMYPAWMVPPVSDREPNPSYDDVVSFIRLHEHVFTAPASRFMRGLCYQYGVEIHNFAPNAISQARASSPSAKGSWGSQQTGISGCSYFAWSFTHSPRARREYVEQFALTA
jgi:hypothetical protein